MNDPLGLSNLSDHDLLVALVMEHRNMTEGIDNLTDALKAQNGRITALERWRWVITGGLLALSMLFPLLIYGFRQTIAQALGGG